jgi:threonine/homoserine/homoserine lactone efflux protein
MYADSIQCLILGLTLGLSAGFSPGPILALVIGETLNGGFKDGLKVAAAPLLTDGPIILACFVLLSAMADSGAVLGIISLAGDAYLVKLGMDSFRAGPPGEERRGGPGAFKKAVLANFLNPNPYLFWLTVGAPILISGRRPLTWAAFLAGFYVCLVGAKIGIAAAAAKSRRLIRGRGYILILRVLGAALVVFAAIFVRKGLDLLGWIS